MPESRSLPSQIQTLHGLRRRTIARLSDRQWNRRVSLQANRQRKNEAVRNEVHREGAQQVMSLRCILLSNIWSKVFDKWLQSKPTIRDLMAA